MIYTVIRPVHCLQLSGVSTTTKPRGTIGYSSNRAVLPCCCCYCCVMIVAAGCHIYFDLVSMSFTSRFRPACWLTVIGLLQPSIPRAERERLSLSQAFNTRHCCLYPSAPYPLYCRIVNDDRTFRVYQVARNGSMLWADGATRPTRRKRKYLLHR